MDKLKQKGIILVFDMDGVLLTSDQSKEKEHLFLNLDLCSPIKENMIQFIRFKESKRVDICILTTRHPIVAMDIYRMFDCQVFTRDFCYSIDDMQNVEKTKENTEIFLSKMVDYKVNILKCLALKYKKVIFIDDMIERFDKSKLCSNIDAILPSELQFYNQKGKRINKKIEVKIE